MEIFIFFTTLFLLGCAHGLEPGHGKLLVTSYLTGSEAKIKDAFTLGILVAFFHTLSVALLGGIVVFLAFTFFREAFLNSLEVLSGVVILCLGLLLFWRRFIMKSKHEDQCDCHFLHSTPAASETLSIISHTPVHLTPASVGKVSLAEPVIQHKSNLKEIVLLSLASGMTPCPMALAALIAAFGMGKAVTALGALTVFSLGIGSVLIVLGIVLIQGSTALQSRWESFKKAPVIIARASTIVVLLLGCYLIAKPFVFSEDSKAHTAESINFLMPMSYGAQTAK